MKVKFSTNVEDPDWMNNNNKPRYSKVEGTGKIVSDVSREFSNLVVVACFETKKLYQVQLHEITIVEF